MKKKLPEVIASTLVKRGNKYFLTKELMKSGECWIVPGGHVEFGESLEEAAKREIKEETGMDVEIVELIGHHEAIFPQYDYHTVIFFFLAKPLSQNITLEEVVLDGQFFTKKEIQNLNLIQSAKWLFERI